MKSNSLKMNKIPIEKICQFLLKKISKISEIFLIKHTKTLFSRDLKSKKFGSDLYHKLILVLKKLLKKLLKSLF